MDRITRVKIQDVRAIASLTLDISPMTVLIGENGSGKSTILEVLEILRKAADPRLIDQLYKIHRGPAGLLRKGSSAMRLGVVVEDSEGVAPGLEFEFELADLGSGFEVSEERLVATPRGGPPTPVLTRRAQRPEVLDPNTGEYVALSTTRGDRERLSIHSVHAQVRPEVPRLLQALADVEVHLGFDTIAAWAARSYQFSLSMRGSVTLQRAERLQLLGFNLANAWMALKNAGTSEWHHTLELVRLGLGEAIDDVIVAADVSAGNVALALKRVELPEPIPAANLSDGQLSWLAFVALARLHPRRTLLAIDEPELHLHPSLLGRVIALLAAQRGAPVVLSTHSDRVLEVLDDPADAVRVCSLGTDGLVTVDRLDPDELPRWLDEFGDLGQLRAQGYLSRVLRRGSEA